DPHALESVDIPLERLYLVEELGAGERTRRHLRLRGDVDADDADGLAAIADDGVRLYVAVLQWRVVTGDDVRSQGDRAAIALVEPVEELGESVVTVVELVVAELEYVEADLVHRRGVGLALEQRVEESAGDGISGVDLQHVVLLGSDCLDLGRYSGKATH